MSDIIDINVNKTVEQVEILVTENLTTVNVNTITGTEDPTAVKLTTNQTIDGIKTFLKPIILQSQTNTNQAELYVEGDEFVVKNGDGLIPFQVKRGVMSLRTISSSLIRFLFSGSARDFTLPASGGTIATESYVDTGLSTKLDASLYNDRYKGKFTSLANLQTALPTAHAGDYAQVDEGSGSLVKNYNYDLEDGWVIGGAGSGATSTDALIEGSTNLYFTTARVLATLLSGLSVATGGAIVSTDSVLVAFGKLQKQITDAISQLYWTRTGNNITNNNSGTVTTNGDFISNGTVRANYSGFKIGDGFWSIDREGVGDQGAMRFVGREAGGTLREIFKFVSANGRQYFNIDSDSNLNFYGNIIIDVPPPTGLVAVVNPTGGTIGAGNRQYRVTSLNTNGESTTSIISSFAFTTGSTNSITLSWAAVSGATSYRIYTFSGGTFTGQYFTSLTNSFTDTGATGTAGALPTTNTAVAISLLNNGKVIIPPATASNEAVNKGQLDLKANTANPTFTGSVVVPNATAPNEAVNLSQLQNENNVYQFHDFLTGSANEFISGQNINSGTFAQNQTNQTINNPGVVRLTSSTTANSGASWRTSSVPLRLKGQEVCNFIINPLTFSNTTFRAGIHNTTNSVEPTVGVYFEYSNSGVLTLKTSNNNTPVSTSTITTLSINTWYKLRLIVNLNATIILAEVFDNVGVLIASVTQTTNIPSIIHNLNAGFICTNSGTTATPLIDVDFMDLKQTLIR